ncbi:hypothetical protein RMN57_22970 [Kitasatospora sp. CM 4170]|uniref:Guanylate cyclase domain-containing protein n=1 Tax=Kitasatospora aburaviensis TaxID=67265 RepID=A0ABW1F360_9ACTN|nr:hypothetical protein [Kitasatospora sp. CM 4170]WNM47355.1 hypothetical protein RMN57_22970 [Kitasatospora sp. CM 4170]
MIEHVRKIFFGLDIVGFNQTGRTDIACLDMRRGLYDALGRALAAGSLEAESYDLLDRGDGIMAVIDESVELHTVASRVVPALTSAIHEYNHSARPDAQIRLRAALHSGDVFRDDHGYVGRHVSHAFRLLDGPELRGTLAASVAVLALAVSESAWRELEPPTPGGPEFTSILISTKERAARAWVAEFGASPALVG